MSTVLRGEGVADMRSRGCNRCKAAGSRRLADGHVASKRADPGPGGLPAPRPPANPPGAPPEPAVCHHAAMAHNFQPDLSNACWRCQHWGGPVASMHANCTRNGYLQADPRQGVPIGLLGLATISRPTTGRTVPHARENHDLGPTGAAQRTPNAADERRTAWKPHGCPQVGS